MMLMIKVSALASLGRRVDELSGVGFSLVLYTTCRSHAFSPMRFPFLPTPKPECQQGTCASQSLAIRGAMHASCAVAMLCICCHYIVSLFPFLFSFSLSVQCLLIPQVRSADAEAQLALHAGEARFHAVLVALDPGVGGGAIVAETEI